MSTATSIISSSAAVSYATQLAQTSALKRSLTSLGMAIQKGELVPASTILTAFFKANPQYTSASSEDSPSPDPLSQDFQTLATAISNNQVDAAQTAWTQIKSDFANDGVTNLSDGTTSEVPAQNKASTDEQIVSDMSGDTFGGGVSVATLLGRSANDPTGSSSSQIGDWLTYHQNGTAAPAAPPSSAGDQLNTAV